jgi:hypothetical protein
MPPSMGATRSRDVTLVSVGHRLYDFGLITTFPCFSLSRRIRYIGEAKAFGDQVWQPCHLVISESQQHKELVAARAHENAPASSFERTIKFLCLVRHPNILTPTYIVEADDGTVQAGIFASSPPLLTSRLATISARTLALALTEVATAAEYFCARRVYTQLSPDCVSLTPEDRAVICYASLSETGSEASMLFSYGRLVEQLLAAASAAVGGSAESATLRELATMCKFKTVATFGEALLYLQEVGRPLSDCQLLTKCLLTLVSLVFSLHVTAWRRERPLGRIVEEPQLCQGAWRRSLWRGAAHGAG